MGKFLQISTELRPLIYLQNCVLLNIFCLIGVRNWFSFSIFGISLPIFFKLCMKVDIGKECLRIEDV